MSVWYRKIGQNLMIPTAGVMPAPKAFSSSALDRSHAVVIAEQDRDKKYTDISALKEALIPGVEKVTLLCVSDVMPEGMSDNDDCFFVTREQLTMTGKPTVKLQAKLTALHADLVILPSTVRNRAVYAILPCFSGALMVGREDFCHLQCTGGEAGETLTDAVSQMIQQVKNINIISNE